MVWHFEALFVIGNLKSEDKKHAESRNLSLESQEDKERCSAKEERNVDPPEHLMEGLRGFWSSLKSSDAPWISPKRGTQKRTSGHILREEEIRLQLNGMRRLRSLYSPCEKRERIALSDGFNLLKYSRDGSFFVPKCTEARNNGPKKRGRSIL